MDLRQTIDRQGQLLGVSVAELARRCGMSPSSLHRLRRARSTWNRFPELDTLPKVARGLELPLEALFVAAGVSCGLVEDGLILSGRPSVVARPGRAQLAVTIPVGYRTDEEIERVKGEISDAITWVMALLNYRDGALVVVQPSLG